MVNNHVKKFVKIDDRLDLGVIASLIEDDNWVLDLGCGSGALLEYLIKTKDVKGMGIDINIEKTIACMKKGIPVIHQDLNEGLSNFKDDTFDYMVLSQTLQVVQHPDELMLDMLRVAQYGIVSFPNFGYYRMPLKLFLNGRMPISKTFPYDWYNTPNIHLVTLRDFREFCHNHGIVILKEYHNFGEKYSSNGFFANKRAKNCVAMITLERKMGK